MKKLVALLACLAALSVRAQDTAVLNEDDQWKMYTTPQVTFGEVDGDWEPMAGIGIGTILNDQWTFGLAGHINFSDIDTDNGAAVDQWDFWYAGGEVGYIFAPTKLVHLNLDLFLGGGEIQGQDSFFGGNDDASFFVYQPTLSVCLNLHQTWEFGVGIGYRGVEGGDIEGLSGSDLSGAVGSVFFRATEY